MNVLRCIILLRLHIPTLSREACTSISTKSPSCFQSPSDCGSRSVILHKPQSLVVGIDFAVAQLFGITCTRSCLPESVQQINSMQSAHKARSTTIRRVPCRKTYTTKFTGIFRIRLVNPRCDCGTANYKISMLPITGTRPYTKLNTIRAGRSRVFPEL